MIQPTTQALPTPYLPALGLEAAWQQTAWQQRGACHLGYADPARGPVPNPGMGLVGYVLSDWMVPHIDESQPPQPLDRKAFDDLLDLPLIDQLYIRPEWRMVQREPGRLELPEAWDWLLEGAAARGKPWSFRVVHTCPHSLHECSAPDFVRPDCAWWPYHVDNKPGPHHKLAPRYDEAFLRHWGDFQRLLAARFDADPLLESVDVGGYGFWGEFHHLIGPWHHPVDDVRAETVMRRVLEDQLAAFTRTPTVMQLQPEGGAPMERVTAEAMARGCWLRRDSFSAGYTPWEWRQAQRRRPGAAYVFEVLMNDDANAGGMPGLGSDALPQRLLDSGFALVSIGFNPWQALRYAKEHVAAAESLRERLGYRLRPAITWHRPGDAAQGPQLGVALLNEGSSWVTGQLTLQGELADGRRASALLPPGEPRPGAPLWVELAFPPGAASALPATYAGPHPWDFRDSPPGAASALPATLSLSTRIGAKAHPVRWAIRPDGRLSADGLRFQP